MVKLGKIERIVPARHLNLIVVILNVDQEYNMIDFVTVDIMDEIRKILRKHIHRF